MCASPLFGIGWLPVVVRVEEQRALRAGSFPFGVNGGRRVWRVSFEQPRLKSAQLHHLHDPRGVAADVLDVAGDVWQRKEVEILAE